MKNTVRLVLGIMMAGCIYYLALYAIPSFGLLKGLLKLSWISKGDITQISLLVLSFILICLLSKGNLSTYGFSPAKTKQLIKSVLISIPVPLVMIVVTMIMIIITGTIPKGSHPAAKYGLIKTIISIWLIASTCEEIFYRGLILSFLAPLKEYGFKLFGSHISLPVIVSAIGFGLGHLCLLSQMEGTVVTGIVVSATLLGFIAGYFREKTGSLVPAIAAHMTFNIVGFTIGSLLGGGANV
jgi:membrane protease YdiL (CAAX protease family)